MTTLAQEFERLRPALLTEGRKCDADGAYARAMLALVPAFVAHARREQATIAIRGDDSFEGLINALRNLVYHGIREFVPEEARLRALDVVLRHIDKGVRPKLERSKGGIILPNGESALQ